MVQHSLQQVRAEIREYRRKRGPSAHLSKELRQAVVALSAMHGATGLSRDLKINQESIKRWRESAPPESNPKVQKSQRVEFVEIKTSPEAHRTIWPVNSGSSIEIARPDGWIIRMSGGVAKEFAGVMLSKFTNKQQEIL